MKAKSSPTVPVVALILGLTGAAHAQVAVPTTPTKFDIKPITGPTSTAGATINPSSKTSSITQTTYLTLSPLRQWTNPEGKTLMGKLIAWEQTTATTTAPAAPVEETLLTNRPTVLKNGKARLLIDNKAYEIDPARLDPASQKFINDLQSRLSAAPPTPDQPKRP